MSATKRPLNVIGLCQGANLNVFANLIGLIQDSFELRRVGAFVADSAYFIQQLPNLDVQFRDNSVWLKEWESYAHGLARKPDLNLIDKFQNENKNKNPEK